MTTIDPLTGRLVRTTTERGQAIVDEKDEGGGFKLFDVDDALLFAPRAAEGLVRSTVGLVDIIPGVDTGIADRRSELLGRSDSLIGGLLEGFTQVLIPYGAFTKGLRSVAFLNTAAKSAAAGSAAAKAGRGVATLQRFGKEAIAGAGADFVAFGGNEGRLSDLIETIGLGNPLTSALATEEGDTELEGRLKNVFEGAGIGIAAEAVTSVLKSFRKGRQAIDKGATTVEAEKVIQEDLKANKTEDKVRDLLNKVESGSRAHSRKIKEERTKVVGEPTEQAGDTLTGRTDDALEDVGATPAEGGAKTDTTKAHKKITAKLGAMSFVDAIDRGIDPSKLLRDRVGLSKDQTIAVLARFRALARENAGAIQDRLGGDGRKLTEDQRAMIGMSEGGMNLSGMVEDEDVIALVRAVEGELAQRQFPLRTSKQSETEMILAGLGAVKDLTQLSNEELIPFVAQFVDDTRRVGSLSIALQVVMGSAANRALAGLRHAEGMLTGRPGLEPVQVKELGFEGLEGDDVLEEVLSEMRRLAIFRDGRAMGGSNLGRSLRSLGVPTSPGMLSAVEGLPDVRSAQALKNMIGDKEFAKRLEMIRSVSGMPSLNRTASLTKMADMTLGRRILAVSTEWFIEALLSSPKTLATNFLFPLATSMYVPLEHMVGGSLQFLATGGSQGGSTVTRSMNSLIGMTMSLGEASTASLRAFREGPQLNPRNVKRDDQGQALSLISSDALGQLFGPKFGPEAPFAAVIDAVGKMARLPTRVMNSTDEFTKVLSGRGLAYARLVEEAAKNGEDIATFVPDAMSKMFVEGQAVTDDFILRRARETAQTTGDPVGDVLAVEQRVKEVSEELRFDELNPITQEALSRGDEVAATTDLAPGTLGYRYQAFVKSVPQLRIITPFIRTPTNLVKFAGQRFDPIGLMNVAMRKLTHKGLENAEASRFRNVQDMLSNDPQRKAEALGRMTTGFGTFAAFVTLAGSGTLTGAGPDDPERRKLLLSAGWLPYSVKIGDTYTQFLRADPFAITMGLAADLVEVSRFRYNEDQDMFDAAVVSAWTAVTRNVVNRTYMAGLRSMMDAVSRGEQFASSAIAGLAGGFLIPRFAQAVAGVNDPVIHDASGIIERLRARTPFLSKDVAPLRDVLGDPMDRVMSLGADPDSPASLWFDMIVPVAYREVKDKTIRGELASLNHGFAPPRQVVNGVDLGDIRSRSGQSAYDVWQEQHGKVRVGGRTLAQEFRKLFRSRQYRDLPRESSPSIESPRVRLVRNAIGRFRAAAWEQTLNRFPELSTRLNSIKQDRRRAKAGLRPNNPLPEVPQPFQQFVQEGR